MVRSYDVHVKTLGPYVPALLQHAEECGEKAPPLEVGDGNYGGLEEENKLSLPVRAYFFSTILVEQNKLNFIYVVSSFKEMNAFYMVVFQYGSIVLFNVREHQVNEYINLVERHASGLLSEMRKDEPSAVFLARACIALDYYGRQVDGMVAEFTDINRGMEKTGTFTMDRKKLFQLVRKANSNLADVILKLCLFER
ncbi:hypothetical protein N665_0096s0001 [Sinapis alba]|nr:hypothetical protein N665_0096s0001 [Sinapis alba]